MDFRSAYPLVAEAELDNLLPQMRGNGPDSEPSWVTIRVGEPAFSLSTASTGDPARSRAKQPCLNDGDG